MIIKSGTADYIIEEGSIAYMELNQGLLLDVVYYNQQRVHIAFSSIAYCNNALDRILDVMFRKFATIPFVENSVGKIVWFNTQEVTGYEVAGNRLNLELTGQHLYSGLIDQAGDVSHHYDYFHFVWLANHIADHIAGKHKRTVNSAYTEDPDAGIFSSINNAVMASSSNDIVLVEQCTFSDIWFDLKDGVDLVMDKTYFYNDAAQLGRAMIWDSSSGSRIVNCNIFGDAKFYFGETRRASPGAVTWLKYNGDLYNSGWQLMETMYDSKVNIEFDHAISDLRISNTSFFHGWNGKVIAKGNYLHGYNSRTYDAEHQFSFDNNIRYQLKKGGGNFYVPFNEAEDDFYIFRDCLFEERSETVATDSAMLKIKSGAVAGFVAVNTRFKSINRKTPLEVFVQDAVAVPGEYENLRMWHCGFAVPPGSSLFYLTDEDFVEFTPECKMDCYTTVDDDTTGEGDFIVDADFKIVSPIVEEALEIKFNETNYLTYRNKEITDIKTDSREPVTYRYPDAEPKDVYAVYRGVIAKYWDYIFTTYDNAGMTYVINVDQVASFRKTSFMVGYEEYVYCMVIDFKDGLNLELTYTTEDARDIEHDYLQFLYDDWNFTDFIAGKTVRTVMHVGADHTTIQAAVDASSSGDVVVVMPYYTGLPGGVSDHIYNGFEGKNGVDVWLCKGTVVTNSSGSSAPLVKNPSGGVFRIFGGGKFQNKSSNAANGTIGSAGTTGKVYIRAESIEHTTGAVSSFVGDRLFIKADRISTAGINGVSDNAMFIRSGSIPNVIIDAKDITGYNKLLHSTDETVVSKYSIRNAEVKVHGQIFYNNESSELIEIESINALLKTTSSTTTAGFTSITGDAGEPEFKIYLWNSFVETPTGRPMAEVDDARGFAFMHQTQNFLNRAIIGENVDEGTDTDGEAIVNTTQNASGDSTVEFLDILYFAQPVPAILSESEPDIIEPEAWKVAIINEAAKILEANLQM